MKSLLLFLTTGENRGKKYVNVYATLVFVKIDSFFSKWGITAVENICMYFLDAVEFPNYIPARRVFLYSRVLSATFEFFRSIYARIEKVLIFKSVAGVRCTFRVWFYKPSNGRISTFDPKTDGDDNDGEKKKKKRSPARRGAIIWRLFASYTKRFCSLLLWLFFYFSKTILSTILNYFTLLLLLCTG